MVAAVLVPGAALAQGPAGNFPSKPVRIIVAFPPGGATDITARLIGEKLQLKWGQPVIIENRPGGGSNIGADIVAKAPPDGYTIVLGVTGSHGINISLYKKMPYHPLKDFEPITQTTLYPNATPKPIIDKMAAEMIAAMQMPDVMKKMADIGTPLVGSGPEAFRAFVTKEIEKWAEAVRVAGVSAD